MAVDGLKKALRVRHLIMLSVGGTIASGFFLASGAAISVAGPGVIITYAVAGFITLLVMASLAELSVQKPVSGSFAIYAQDTMGPWAGFLTGWNYWLAWIMGAAAESIAAGTFIHAFYHSIPVWLVAFVMVSFEGTINIVGVLLMGEYEFVISSIKLIALGLFVIVGFAAIFGIGVSHPLGFHNLTAHGGFFPSGFKGIYASLLTVFFAYVGIELVGVTAEESVHPERDVPRALIWTVVIIAGLFILGTVALLGVLPWQHAGVASSPFVDALKVLNWSPTALAIFNFTIVLASLSSIDGGIYTASRMLFAMSREGYFPKRLSEIHPKRHTPTLAIIVTSVVIFVGAIVAVIAPTFAYTWIFGLATFGWMWAWFMIGLSHIKYRNRMTKEEVKRLKWRMPGYPVGPILIMIATAGAIVGQFFVPGGWVVNVAGTIWIAISLGYYFAYGRKSAIAKQLPDVVALDGEGF